MNESFRAASALAAVLLGASALAAAQVPDPAEFRVGGFGTLAYTRASLDDAGFRTLASQEKGATTDGSFKVDSRFGLRVDAREAEPLALTIQGIVKMGADARVRPELDWAYLRYRVDEGTRVRLGRIRMPYYMRSDSLDVNYAQPWLRLPPDMYSLLLTQNVDGADLVHERPVGEFTLAVQPAAGVSPRTELGSGFSLRIKPAGVSVSLGTLETTARVSFGGARVDIASAEVAAARSALEAHGLGTVGNDYRLDATSLRYLNLGVNHESRHYFVTAELMRLRFDGAGLPDATSAYIGGGYRNGKVSVFALASGLRTSGRREEDRLPPLPALAPVKACLDSLLFDGYRDQRTLSAGVRWDVVERGALKYQLDQVRVPAGARGNWTQPVPEGRRPLVHAVSFDFVF